MSLFSNKSHSKGNQRYEKEDNTIRNVRNSISIDTNIENMNYSFAGRENHPKIFKELKPSSKPHKKEINRIKQMFD